MILGLVFVLVQVVLTLNVPDCGSSSPPILTFSYYNGSVDPTRSTQATLCHTA